MEKILKYFKSKPAQSFFYAAVLIIFSSAAVILFIWSLIFIVGLIDSIVITEDEELPVLAFNFTDSIVLSRKLGIVFPAEILVSSTSSAETIPTLSEISVQILNGTNTKGLAKSWEEKFKIAGFLKIETANAPKGDYQMVEIKYKPAKKDVLNLVKEVLTNNQIATSSIKETEEEGSYDFIIILGK